MLQNLHCVSYSENNQHSIYNTFVYVNVAPIREVELKLPTLSPAITAAQSNDLTVIAPSKCSPTRWTKSKPSKPCQTSSHRSWRSIIFFHISYTFTKLFSHWLVLCFMFAWTNTCTCKYINNVLDIANYIGILPYHYLYINNEFLGGGLLGVPWLPGPPWSHH